MNKKKIQLFKPINLASEVKLKKKKTGLFISSNLCFLQVKAIWPRSSQMWAPPTKIANCQINSVFHLAKHISGFLSCICEDGWKCAHISHSDPQQMLDFIARKKKKILNAVYTSPITRVPFMVSIQLLERHRDPQIFSVLETKDFCSMIPTLRTKVGELWVIFGKWILYLKKTKKLKLDDQILLTDATYLDFEGKEYNFCSGLFLWQQPLLLAVGVVPAPGLVSSD